ncbi:hypothetical protein R2G56_07775 [Nitratireductor aquimarinus]|uniref:UrcA family protein n=1 Tax=Nitratireductor aquimarinus TaxID=889300 RepID=A0ABU4AIW4_9HYPH|nr:MULTISPECIES: hypothetical protein [Alphaproteobacteria]MBY6023988.1 hypothetical protein [Nitratireductor sp. DP7N14-4]MBN7759027.1 hypothetical protein [Nitratireductor aquimarinus]MBN7763484.1 hypothetical protein [Nitratireductor aquibiodomus]MBN7778751.1 hypothetical protein [Nitratireductor pacificus]MBN7783074.1 hypothetical protein [Nitratireductor pacificus]
MLRYIALTLGMVVLASPAGAISRYTSTAMSCAEAQARINAEGAAIMRYQSRNNPSLPRYDRYVANENFCPVAHIAVRDYIPTADRESCPVLRCKAEMRERLFDRRWIFRN